MALSERGKFQDFIFHFLKILLIRHDHNLSWTHHSLFQIKKIRVLSRVVSLKSVVQSEVICFKYSVSSVWILKWLFTVVVPGPEPLGFWSGIYSLSIMIGLFFSSAKYHGVGKERINSSIFRFINMHSCWYIT